MKSFSKKLLLALMLVGTSIIYSQSASDPLVGVWANKDQNTFLTYKADGTFSLALVLPKGAAGSGSWNAEWTRTGNLVNYTITASTWDENQIGISYTNAFVLSNNNKTLTIIDIEGNGSTPGTVSVWTKK